MSDLTTLWLAVSTLIWSYNLVAGIWVFADWLRWRKIDAWFRDHPTGIAANLTPPTMAELNAAVWIRDLSERP
jgi:hypothetical protein